VDAPRRLARLQVFQALVAITKPGFHAVKPKRPRNA
jgi:hypothetical protein